MRVLAFDTATTTGWAVGDLRGERRWGSFTLPRTGANIGLFLIFAERRIEELVAQHRPKMLAYEAPLLIPRADNPEKLQRLLGLVSEVEKCAERRSLPCEKATLGQIRTHFLGAGYRNQTADLKARTKVKCRDMGYDVADDNEADAMALLDYMLSLQRPALAVQSTPLFQAPARRARARRIA